MRAVRNIGMVLCVLIAGAGQAAAEDKLEVGVDLTHAERYIWRGIPLNQEYVLQPSLTVGKSGFYVNFWSNLDMTDYGDSKKIGYGDETGNATEIDFSAGYEQSFDKVTLGFGFINYTFPHTGLAATTEVYGSIGLDVPLSPSLTAYVDEDAAEGASYVSLDIGHSFGLWESGDASVAFDLSGHLGYADGKWVRTYYGINKDARFNDWSASAALPVSFGYGVSLTPAYVYSSLMTDQIRDQIDLAGLEKEVGIFTLTLSLAGEI